MASNVLEQLRDIHLPPAISFWPLAWGWYVLALLLVSSSFIVGYYFYRRWQRHSSKKILLQQLQRIRLLPVDANSSHLAIAELSILLRRVALANFPRQQVAGLSGENWLAFLDETGNTKEFSQGVGRLLITAPYQPHRAKTNEALFSLIKQWLEYNT